MRQYWINFKGNQSGPHSKEELVRMGVDKTAYVWHSGLDDWVKITKVTELNEMLENMASGVSSPASTGVEDVASQADDIYEPTQATDLLEDDVPELPPNYLGYPGGTMGNATRQGRYYPKYAGGSGNFTATQAVAETQKCPPTNLVWAIITTLCCCTPLGIAGIIFAYYTKKYYKEGNYQKAEKFSEYGAWAIIASIVMAIVSMPLFCILSLR